jgi:DNA-binding transcriptional LysR family regulator
LRIAATGVFAQLHLVRWLPGFLAQHQDLRVELTLDARYTDLISDHIDVAIRLGHLQPTSAVAKKLCAMPRAIVASPKLLDGRSGLKPEAVGTVPCLLFPHEGYGPSWKFRDRRGKVREFEPRSRVIAADGMILRSLAVDGEGLALLPRWLCAEELAAGSLVDVFPAHDVTATEFDAAVSLLYASRSYLPLKVRVFVEFVTELFRNGPPWEAVIR